MMNLRTRIHVPHPYSVSISYKKKGMRKVLQYFVHVSASSPIKAEIAANTHYKSLFRSHRIVNVGTAVPIIRLENNSWWGKCTRFNTNGITYEQWESGIDITKQL